MPPDHPNLQLIRKNYAKYAGAVENMDRKVQETLDALKKDGLADETIVIYNSDHGGVMPRAKRFVYDGLAAGDLKPIVARTFRLDDIVEAHRYMESNQQIGKIVVLP